MNRKTGSIELLDMDNTAYNKNLNLEGYRTDPKGNIMNKPESVSNK